MNHQPYENWLFEKDLISLEQTQALEEHFKNCPDCQQKYISWQYMQTLIESIPPVKPKPGFSQRWRASLEERLMREQLRQTRRFFLVLAGASTITLALLFIKMLATTSPVDLMVSAFQALTRVIVVGVNIRDLFIEWLPSIPLAVPLLAWIAISLLICGLIGYWGISVWRMINKGATSK
jgi:hypothetical protein